MRAFLYGLLVVLAGACGNYHQDLSGNSSDEVLGTHGFKTLSFDAVKAIVFEPYCSNCHFASKGPVKGKVNLENFAGTIPHLDDIKTDVVTGNMPKGMSLPGYAEVVLLAWLKNDHPETSDIPLPDPNTKPPAPPPPSPPGFDTISKNIFGPYCSRCHTEISDYDYVIANLQKIEDDVITNKPPTMPKNEKPLPAKLQQQLKAWIDKQSPKGFSEIQRKVFVPYCVRCHSYMTDIKKVSANIDDILDMVKQDKMPADSDPTKPPNPLTQAQKDDLNNWVKAGMPL